MNWLAFLIHDNDMTQGELGELVGVSRVSINHYARGLVRPSDEVLDRIALALRWEGDSNKLLEEIELGGK